jgi:hypothetical protein
MPEIAWYWQAKGARGASAPQESDIEACLAWFLLAYYFLT